MGTTANIEYLGELRTQAVHISSKSEITTDAPTDNNGKGELFSPTDLVATALVSCMITVMGIHAQKNNLHMGDLKGNVEKIMVSAPRRISMLNLELTFTGHRLNESEKKHLETIAINCPVAKSIHPDIAMNVKFSYS